MGLHEEHLAVRGERNTSQWEALLRKFSESHKEECQIMSFDIPQIPRSVKKFPTGSQYEGTWDVLGMSGHGTYTFCNEVIYKGEFEDGLFHGIGELEYPSGIKIKGKWDKGHIVERKLIFADGLVYSTDNWKYCESSDRRFSVEYEKGLQPNGVRILTADQPTRKIPDGCYDTGDGFYDPKTEVIIKADGTNSINRAPSDLEKKWIVKNCRKSPDIAVGFQPDLYEEWQKPKLRLAPTPAPEPPFGRTASTTSFDWKPDLEHVFYDPRWMSMTSESESLRPDVCDNNQSTNPLAESKDNLDSLPLKTLMSHFMSYACKALNYRDLGMKRKISLATYQRLFDIENNVII